MSRDDTVNDIPGPPGPDTPGSSRAVDGPAGGASREATMAYSGAAAGGEADGRVLGVGEHVEQFKIQRFLGRGGMGEVYLARDMQLGRKVALKVLLTRMTEQPDSVDRFLFEARATARFNFPHIVTVYSVGEHRGYPFIAMEYLTGQSLRERMDSGELATLEGIRIGLAIAEALQEAHRHQLLHRDLKPENVMIPTDGRIRVVDFGLATFISDAPPDRASMASLAADSGAEGLGEQQLLRATRGLRGTPAYMAPEQWLGDPVTGATDMWALGMVLYELVTGANPFVGLNMFQVCHQVSQEGAIPPVTGDHPQELVALIQRCLQPDPQRRPDVIEAVEILANLLPSRRLASETDRSPFRGLLPFDEQHADRFFGRDAEIAAFVERLRHEPVLPVVGPSGSGKSSFVQAGVIPRLREQGRWIVLHLRPGSRPMLALATRLRAGGHTRPGQSGTRANTTAAGWSRATDGDEAADWDAMERSWAEQLALSPSALALELSQLAEEQDARVLLFVDQAEELYTLVEDVDLRRSFMEAICLAADDPEGPVRVVLTLREDFIGRMVQGPASRAALGRATVVVTPGREALEEIVTRTAARAGYGYQPPDIPAQMVAEVFREAAALPMLQFAGTALWDRRDQGRKVLLGSVYEDVGGVAGCMAHHADGLIQALSAGQVETARIILLRLVTPEGTRRVLTRSKLLFGLGDDAPEVLDGLVRGRLILVRKALHGGSEEAELELVHEALIRSWLQLTRWIEDSRDEIILLAQLEQAAELWDKRGGRDELLWHGEALLDARRELDGLSSDVPELAARFLEASSRQEAAGRARRRNRLLGTVGLVFAAVLLAGGLVWTLGGAGPPCRNADDRLAGVWDDQTASAVHEAFLGVDRVNAEESFQRVDGVLDRYAARWTAMYTEACEATHVRGEQSEQVLDLRMECLNRRRSELDALVQVLSGNLDADALDRAVQASYELSSIATCADVDALGAAVPPPDDPAARERVRQLREDLARAEALERTGQVQQALAIAQEVSDAAGEVGYLALRAEVRFLLGSLYSAVGRLDDAEATLYEAADAAAACGDDVLAARALIGLVSVIGFQQARYHEGLAYQRVARIAVSLAGDDEALQAALLHGTGNIYLQLSRYDEAQRNFEQAVALRERALGPEHPDLAKSLNNLGLVLYYRGDHEGAGAAYDRALAIKRQTLGPRHPSVAASLDNLGLLYDEAFDIPRARELYLESLAIKEAMLGPQNPELALTLNNLGQTYLADGDCDEALALVDRAVALTEARPGADHPDQAIYLSGRSGIYECLGRWDEARQDLERAEVIRRQSFGPNHPEVASNHNNLGNLYQVRGDLRTAERVYLETLDIIAATDQFADDIKARVLTNLGKLYREQGKFDLSRQVLEEARQLKERDSGPDSAALSVTLVQLGALDRAVGDLDAAKGHYLRAVTIREARFGVDNREVAEPLAGLAGCYLDAGQIDTAIPLLERGERLLAGGTANRFVLAGIRLDLARAYWSSGGNLQHAIDLAQQARVTFNTMPDLHRDELSEVDAWLRQRQ